MDTFSLLLAIVCFLAVVLALEGGYMLWKSYRGTYAVQIQRRLQALSAGGHAGIDAAILKQRVLSRSAQLERVILQMPRVERLDRVIMQSGMELTVASFLGTSATFAAAGLLLWVFLPLPFWTAPVFIFVPAILPGAYVLRKRSKRLRAIEEQLPDALELMSRAMRAGHAFASSVQMVSEEGPEPIRSEFKIAFDEINYGVATHDALMNLATRVPITDLRFFVIAVAIQRETGGNLAELLSNLAALMRARFKLLGTIRVLSTEGRMSGWILTILPFALLGAINAINPKFMSILWTDAAGIKAMWMGLTLMIIGIVWMWRVVKIRV
jgi:tight adherence protein B